MDNAENMALWKHWKNFDDYSSSAFKHTVHRACFLNDFLQCVWNIVVIYLKFLSKVEIYFCILAKDYVMHIEKPPYSNAFFH